MIEGCNCSQYWVGRKALFILEQEDVPWAAIDDDRDIYPGDARVIFTDGYGVTHGNAVDLRVALEEITWTGSNENVKRCIDRLWEEHRPELRFWGMVGYVDLIGNPSRSYDVLYSLRCWHAEVISLGRHTFTLYNGRYYWMHQSEVWVCIWSEIYPVIIDTKNDKGNMQNERSNCPFYKW